MDNLGQVGPGSVNEILEGMLGSLKPTHVGRDATMQVDARGNELIVIYKTPDGQEAI